MTISDKNQIRMTRNFNRLYLIVAMTSIIFKSCNLNIEKNSEVLFKLKSPSDTNLNFLIKLLKQMN